MLLNELPLEILEKIFLLIDARTLGNLSQSSKKYKAFLKDPTFKTKWIKQSGYCHEPFHHASSPYALTSMIFKWREKEENNFLQMLLQQLSFGSRKAALIAAVKNRKAALAGKLISIENSFNQISTWNSRRAPGQPLLISITSSSSFMEKGSLSRTTSIESLRALGESLKRSSSNLSLAAGASSTATTNTVTPSESQWYKSLLTLALRMSVSLGYKDVSDQLLSEGNAALLNDCNQE